ncbi:hypothetical protein C7271_18890 [filamentous cyanobacterium CCP5]|nr:hypothetical protein C7271_18890 [filamentous cyanobacterium CCP5]
MYLSSPPASSQPTTAERVRVRRRRPHHPGAHRRHRRATHVEFAAKFLVNGILLTAAATSLVRLVPKIQEQRAELQRVQAAVAIAEQEQTRLKADFGRYFDPQQARAIMQEQSGWESSSQRQIVWVSPESAGN